MGVVVADAGHATLRVTSTGTLAAPGAPLFLGNAGTAMRPLTAAVAAATVTTTITHDMMAVATKRTESPGPPYWVKHRGRAGDLRGVRRRVTGTP